MAPHMELGLIGMEAFKLLEQKLEQQKRQESQTQGALRERVIDSFQAQQKYGGWLIVRQYYAKKPPLRKP